ncbi:M4 family metallopeptidase [Vitiosangium sp. GDMCC 1.1324]|uniref:M4 family metallopeptidase n=1 Tax=Vitiosangium sp. (strain GDMCC 1.1324) TaxID=2138576 RepID=UPI000D3A942B|nr:M4 family metallopeptidase [Vitiosangium sp. GDMCC 1.1324]PTL79571.1 peptidase M4 family protein [Vitiosangium sp. GDMCC 1.1324]
MVRSWMVCVCTVAVAACSSSQQSQPPNPVVVQYPQQVSRALSNAQGKVLTPQDEARATSVVLDADGAEHVRFNRNHRGLRVIGGDFVVHNNANGTLKELSAPLTYDLSRMDIRPGLSERDAIETARKMASLTGNVSSELVILAHERAPALAYEVISEDLSVPQELHLLVDARTGALLDKWDRIETTAAIGTGNSLYVGTVSIATNSIASGFEMRDVTRGNGFYTIDASTNAIFTDADNVWGNGTNSDRASAGVDAHYGLMKTYDYYKNVHGRNGIDNAGNTGYSRVHYGTNYNNAYWYDPCFCMTYGDGDGSYFSPLVSLDVAGHEMTHGVTSRTAGLIYSGESGGLNEATSDIFGSMTEFYANSVNDPGDYLIGEKVYTPSKSGDALRYMYNPSKDGASVNCWYSGVGSLDVHYSSGIANHFFYLLAVGSNGSPASPTCNGSVVTGIGRFAAEKIWYRALTVYMTSSTNYAGARAASLSAANDLYGVGSTQSNTVAAAWSAVNVN